ncbi:carbohydrate ABC transporter permease [Paenibacillus riograndensis]|uniref:Binding-protein-dependent transport system inner membrane protein n=1 Tax=Paenibacillus riograndensis SBR5 TaxID=1073571 RepID=A0A0E3WIL5_9BACL|nr:carbohydrate ABC transporter permease [Paenibacillus riograndensis]CQR57248.1 binding-protein-dependent transport system inner membrane protein [Paenibacillus riograndensis SBR5]
MIKTSLGERIFDICNVIVMVLMIILTLYPMLYILFSSLSEGNRLISFDGILLWPQGFSLEGYKAVLNNPVILSGFKNTFFILVVGLGINMTLTSLGAYFLSRDGVLLQKPIMFFIVFTMFFQGGLVPFYLIVKSYGLLDSLWALILPTAVSTFNLIIMRTYFMAIPKELEESAFLDGAGHFTILFRIFLPLSMPVVAVLILYYGVGHWNSWFNAMIFLRDQDLFPIQLVVRNIILENDNASMLGTTTLIQSRDVAETLKYAAIIVTTAPILLLYPFLQKYFVKGVMVGALKG